MSKIDRVGETHTNDYGDCVTIIEYKNNKNVKIRLNGKHSYEKTTSYSCLRRKEFKTPFSKTINGVGYLGEGKFSAKDKNGKYSKVYYTWKSMLHRCYDEKEFKKFPTYSGCIVCDEWHNFQNFAKWFHENYYRIEGCKMEIDKDILVKGNKIYSPETCVFVPNFINYLFVKNDASRGNDPIGTSFDKDRNKYFSSINKYGKTVRLGRYDSASEAFKVYKIEKEKYIKELADKYRSDIPDKLYEAMYGYKVKITD